jgi:hypothetical protein
MGELTDELRSFLREAALRRPGFERPAEAEEAAGGRSIIPPGPRLYTLGDRDRWWLQLIATTNLWGSALFGRGDSGLKGPRSGRGVIARVWSDGSTAAGLSPAGGRVVRMRPPRAMAGAPRPSGVARRVSAGGGVTVREPMAAPAFFMPDVPEDKAAGVFEALAELAGCPVPPHDERVYRIEWIHDGERWTGEVGRQMHGERITSVGRRKAGMKVSDPAVVLAIFPGVPWLVVTDARPVGTTRSAWVNPFMAGRPERFEYFSYPPRG